MQTINSFVEQLSSMIRLYRKRSGATQKQLAAFAGVGKTVIFDIEHEKSTVKLDTLLKILDVLNIRLELCPPGTHDVQS